MDNSSERRNNGSNLARSNEENEYWRKRREEREKIADRGVRRVWGSSPSHTELELIYVELLLEKTKSEKEKESSDMEEISYRHNKKKKKHSKKRKAISFSDVEEPTNRKHKESKKRKKSKKHSDKGEEEEEEWVELTKELREEEAERTKLEEAQIIGPQIPESLLRSNSPVFDSKLDARDRKNMLKGEAAAMAAYAAQGKRIPRRGEIGLSSGEISEFEKVGYVMSGTRHKSMEATRLRKEDQILTAEEKRLLSNFSQDERRNREETVLNQFRELIASKKSKN